MKAESKKEKEEERGKTHARLCLEMTPAVLRWRLETNPTALRWRWWE